MTNPKPWILAFPIVNLPPSHGGAEAAVIFSLAKPDDPNMAFCTCVDRQNRIYQHVPFLRRAILEASRAPGVFLFSGFTEQKPSNLIGTDGRPMALE